MFFNVGANLRLGNLAHRAAKIAARPHMTTPVPFVQMNEFLLKQARTAPLEVLHDGGRAKFGWTTDQKMNMVRPHMPLDNPNLTTQTALTDQLARPFRYGPAQHLVAILRHPDEVVLDLIDRV